MKNTTNRRKQEYYKQMASNSVHFKVLDFHLGLFKSKNFTQCRICYSVHISKTYSFSGSSTDNHLKLPPTQYIVELEYATFFMEQMNSYNKSSIL